MTDEEIRKERAHIAELEKENIELKEHHKSVCESLTGTHRNLREKLNEAEELISKLYYAGRDLLMCQAELNEDIKQAEQFLKEVDYNKAKEEKIKVSEDLKQKYDAWIKANGGEEGSLYRTFSDEELEHIFLTAYEQKK